MEREKVTYEDFHEGRFRQLAQRQEGWYEVHYGMRKCSWRRLPSPKVWKALKLRKKPKLHHPTRIDYATHISNNECSMHFENEKLWRIWLQSRHKSVIKALQRPCCESSLALSPQFISVTYFQLNPFAHFRLQLVYSVTPMVFDLQVVLITRLFSHSGGLQFASSIC